MPYTPVQPNFFTVDTISLAQNLLGCLLVHQHPSGITVGKIVETEAYLGAADPASHAYRGVTPRNRAMFGPPGHAYIYISYGMHRCLNVTAQPVGVGEGVLLRALQPVQGVELMASRRNIDLPSTVISQRQQPLLNLRQISNGPGKLVQAMAIDLAQYGHDLSQPPLFIAPTQDAKAQIEATPRIGITKAADRLLRFTIKGSPWVSG